jgi:hypothetical protein
MRSYSLLLLVLLGCGQGIYGLRERNEQMAAEDIIVADIGQYYMTHVMNAGFRLWRLLDGQGVAPASIDAMGTALVDEALELHHELVCLIDYAYAQTTPVYQELVTLLDTLSQRIQILRDHTQWSDVDWSDHPLLFSAAVIIEGCQRRLTSTKTHRVLELPPTLLSQ